MLFSICFHNQITQTIETALTYPKTYQKTPTLALEVL